MRILAGQAIFFLYRLLCYCAVKSASVTGALDKLGWSRKGSGEGGAVLRLQILTLMSSLRKPSHAIASHLPSLGVVQAEPHPESRAPAYPRNTMQMIKKVIPITGTTQVDKNARLV